MSVPRNLRKQHEDAEKLRQELYGTPEQDTEESQQQQEGSGEESAQQQESEGEGKQSAEEQHDDTSSEHKLEDETEEQPTTVPKPEYDRLLGAYNTLKGKYDSEVPRLSQQVRDLKQQLEDAQREQPADPAPEREGKPPEGAGDDRIQRLRDEFGDEFADTVQSVAREEATRSIQSSENERKQNERQRFIDTVYRNIPEFDEINTSKAFIQWLNDTPDPKTGGSMKESLSRAGDDCDALAVKQIFDEFLEAQKPQPKSEDNSRQDDPTSPENQVSPGNKGKESAPKQKPSYTPDDYRVLQEQIQRGKWKGKEDEARQLEREIHASIMGG